MGMTLAQFKKAFGAKITRETGCGAIRRHKATTRAEEVVLAELQRNQTEGNYLISQQVRNLFPMAGGGEYIPDFVLMYPNGLMRVIEAKGGYRGAGWEQGYERYKRVATFYSCPMRRFEMWTVGKGNAISVEEWEEKETVS